MMKLLVATFFVIFAASAFADESLEGAKVFNVFPQTKTQHLIVGGMEQHIAGLDMWQWAHIQGREAVMLVPKKSLALFELIMKINKIPFSILMDDPQTTIAEEVAANEQARMAKGDERISFTAFNRHAEVNAYLDELASRYPSRVIVETPGRTPGGRDLKVIKISSTRFTDASKPVIVVDAGIHAREWAAPSVALWMIRKLVEDITESDVANNIDWIIFPVLNPDGYEYSHTNTRLWRKTRSTVSSTSCPGVDGNRNFPFHWMESGSSSNPCSDIFAGPRAFSEMETSALRDQVAAYQSRVKAYLAIHSHGSYFLYPYGYDGSDPPNVVELHNLGVRVGKAIDNLKAPGTKDYLVGNSGTALNYLAAGASDDWAMGSMGVKLAYTLELPSGGSSGFELPPSRIMQVVTESWAGILVLARYVLNGS